MGRRIAAAVSGGLHETRVALLGLAFKPETDDVRESPALAVVNALLRAGAHLHVHDPKGMKAARGLIEGVTFAETIRDCLRDAEILVIATGWEDYARLDPHAVADLMAGRLVFDLRNALPALFLAQGRLHPGAVLARPIRPPRSPSRQGRAPIVRQCRRSIADAVRHERHREKGAGHARGMQ